MNIQENTNLVAPAITKPDVTTALINASKALAEEAYNSMPGGRQDLIDDVLAAITLAENKDSLDLPTEMNAFELLVSLKQQEKELDFLIKKAQQQAIDQATAIGETGQIANIDGAKVTFKLVSVKPKPTDTIKVIQDGISDLQKSLEATNSQRIAELKSELESLTSNDAIAYMEKQLEHEWSLLECEKQPQISVTLPKK